MYIIFRTYYPEYRDESWAIKVQDKQITFYRETYSHNKKIYYEEVKNFNASDILGIGYAILHKNVKISDVL